MLDFILANLPILLCFLLGLGMLFVEVFMPGFGLPGIVGMLLEIAAIVLTYLWHGGLAALGITLVILAVVAIVISLALRSANKGRLSKSHIILNDTEAHSQGYSATQDMEIFLGKEGRTITVLRPSGMAEFDGMKLNVVADGEYIPKDIPVKVERVEGARVVVGKLRTAE
ncbi:MAG: NfeD family protein [Clostridia bacterium]